MNYYLEQISKKKQQLEIAKKGLVQEMHDCTAKVICANDDKESVRNEYADVRRLVEQLSAGLGLVKELEKDIDYLHCKFREELEKERNEEGKK